MNVYEVSYETKYRTLGAKGTWWDSPSSIYVLANGDARKAVMKAEKFVLRSKPIKFERDDGLKTLEKPIAFNLVSVERTCSIDVK